MGRSDNPTAVPQQSNKSDAGGCYVSEGGHVLSRVMQPTLVKALTAFTC